MLHTYTLHIYTTLLIPTFRVVKSSGFIQLSPDIFGFNFANDKRSKFSFGRPLALSIYRDLMKKIVPSTSKLASGGSWAGTSLITY